MRAGLIIVAMQQASDAATEMLIEELARWLRDEVAPVARSGSNWKAIINGKGAADWSFVLEKHGSRRVLSRTTEAST